MIAKTITNTIVPEAERLAFVDRLFGIGYVIRFEPIVFQIAENMALEYNGAYWTFHSLSNGGFYMAPHFDTEFSISCINGYEGRVSPDAMGITACLYAFSHLSFGEDRLAKTCADQYHLLREYVFEHPEADAIVRGID